MSRPRPSPIARAREASKRQQSRFTRRLILVGGAQLLVFGGLGARLHHLQVREADKYRLLAEQNRVSLRLLAVPRGRILDRSGRMLAANERRFQLVFTPEDAPSLEKALQNLAVILRLPRAEIEALETALAKHPRFLPYVVREDLGWRAMSRIEVNTPSLPGVRVVTGARRRYPQGAALGHLVGYVARPNERDVREYPQIRRLAGARVGRSGFERDREAVLRGRPGSVEIEVDSLGRSLRELKRTPGIPGDDLLLTLDAKIQDYTWRRLQSERSASLALIDLREGDVLALASFPGVEPTLFDRGLSDKTWEKLTTDPLTPLVDKSVAGQYAPGSTFKPVVALAALRAGIPDTTRFHCPGHFELGGHRFHCWKKHGHGTVSMYEAIQQSCDVYFYNLALRTGLEAIAVASRELGLGETTLSGAANEKDGLVPSEEWKRRARNEPWHDGETVVLGIGQGPILATPLQLALMTARIATGRRLHPRLALARRTHGASSALELPRPRAHLRKRGLAFAPHHLALVRAAMDGVVNSRRGTAYRRRIEEFGYEMAGKTGTSQVRRITVEERELGIFANKDLPWHRRDHGLFVAYAPVLRPRFAIAVVVEHGGGGSSVAAPIARDVMLFTQREIGTLASAPARRRGDKG